MYFFTNKHLGGGFSVGSSFHTGSVFAFCES